jgi:peptidoglycan/LPS O-acetylase OafA/YrhL
LRQRYTPVKLAEMGLLRAILAITVVFAHTPHPHVFVGGRNAVQVFYMISGFLISYVLSNTPSYRNPLTFWTNRALRLYPTYYVVAVLTLVAYVLFNPGYWSGIAALSDALKVFVVSVHVTLIGQDWATLFAVEDGKLVFFSPGGQSGMRLTSVMLVGQAWTLGVELSFYLIAPFIVSRPRLLIALFGLSLGARLIAIVSGFGLDDPWTDRFFPFELALFIMGMASHQLLLGRAASLVSMAENINVPAWILAGCLIVGLFYYAVPFPDFIKTPILFAIMFFALPFLFILQSRSKLDRRIGDLSYPIYIGHLFVLMALAYVIKKYQFVEPLGLTRSVIGVIGAVAFAVVLNLLVAEPIETWRRQIRGGTITKPIARVT